MGMTCSLRRVNEAEIQRLAEAPEEVELFLFGEKDPAPVPARRGLLGFLSRLSPIRIESPTEPVPGPAETERSDEIDIDKAWHGLHFLFTGTAWEGDGPASFLLCGGQELGGDEEIGQGPPRAHGAEAVRRIAAFLGGLSPAELQRRYDPARMAELKIYPEVIWTRAAPDESPFEYLLAHFQALRAFVTSAADNREGILVFLT